jgi:hypothetical protein
MLTITGTCLDVTSEWIDGPTGRFESITFHLLSGVKVYEVRPQRDFPRESFPKKDQRVSLEVNVSAYATKNGAGFRLSSPGFAQPAALPKAV